MVEISHDLSLTDRISKPLERIANLLFLNTSFIDNPGLFAGKTGIAIFLYHYGRYSGEKNFTDYAGELIDEIYEDVNKTSPLNF
jgi:hypothetical protein